MKIAYVRVYQISLDKWSNPTRLNPSALTKKGKTKSSLTYVGYWSLETFWFKCGFYEVVVFFFCYIWVLGAYFFGVFRNVCRDFGKGCMLGWFFEFVFPAGVRYPGVAPTRPKRNNDTGPRMIFIRSKRARNRKTRQIIPNSRSLEGRLCRQTSQAPKLPRFLPGLASQYWRLLACADGGE